MLLRTDIPRLNITQELYRNTSNSIESFITRLNLCKVASRHMNSISL
jgi:hypothetical protein